MEISNEIKNLSGAIVNFFQALHPEPTAIYHAHSAEKQTEKKEVIDDKEVIIEDKNISAKVGIKIPEATTSVKGRTMEERILDYINIHEEGTRVFDMEVPLGDTRMKIGFISKKLLHEGLVSKIENKYFPLPK
jgi:hypothetical protein